MKIKVSSMSHKMGRTIEHSVEIGDCSWDGLCARFGQANMEKFVLDSITSKIKDFLARCLREGWSEEEIRHHLDKRWYPGSRLQREGIRVSTASFENKDAEIAALKREKMEFDERLSTVLDKLVDLEAMMRARTTRKEGEP